MDGIIIAILSLITLANLFLLFAVIKEIHKLRSVQLNQSLTIVRLMYHQALNIEDFEMVHKIKITMPKDFDYYKF